MGLAHVEGEYSMAGGWHYIVQGFCMEIGKRGRSQNIRNAGLRLQLYSLLSSFRSSSFAEVDTFPE
jgi:hypothetical protein